jgi:hypothetical protein
VEKFSIKQDFKNEIDGIWKNPMYQHINFLERGYAMQDEIFTNAILFVGINPSFSGKLEHKSHFYNNEQDGKIYSYFRKFQDISKKVGIKWAHLDLLFIRETNQRNVENIFAIENGWEFIHDQLNLAKEIIEKAQPKVIVVSNSLAGRLLNSKFSFEFCNDSGTHKIVNKGDLENTPTFFTSMLTGQRALDLGSYERLVWHIKKVVNN